MKRAGLLRGLVAGLIREALSALLARLLLTPLTWMIPRQPGRVAFVGAGAGRFADNTKYLFARRRMVAPEALSVFLSDHPSVRVALSESGHPCAPLSGIKGFWQLLRCQWIAVDSADWREHGRLGAARGARILQLWHGIPLKEIDRLDFERRLSRLSRVVGAMLSAQKRITKRHHPVDILISTSHQVSSRALGRCIAARRIVETGLPRNDVLLDPLGFPPELLQLGVCQRASNELLRHKSEGLGPVVLYAPTFRQSLENPVSQTCEGLRSISRWSTRRNALVLVKLHPFVEEPSVDQLPGILVIKPTSDIYPLLRQVDLLVTDYSSIFFDFLLTDRPIIFHCPDLDRYLEVERGMLFDYASVTPGPKTHTVAELIQHLDEILISGSDAWAADRKRVRSLMFDHLDGASCDRVLSVLGT
jgi:CDP-glycerol glycerophosphotransferase